MSSDIYIVPHDPTWIVSYTHEAKALTSLFTDHIVSIHHIGSTSIPGIVAKPTIDMLMLVNDIHEVENYTDAMTKLDYRAKGEMGMVQRRFFIKGEERTHHLHVWDKSSEELDKHLLFRNYLMTHPDAFQEYQTLKLHLADQFEKQRDSYTFGKDLFIKDILTKAGYQGRLVVHALTEFEKQEYYRFSLKAKNPTIAMDHRYDDEQNHLVFLKGSNVVGACHTVKNKSSHEVVWITYGDMLSQNDCDYFKNILHHFKRIRSLP